jgi:MYXO-CTERM domain-containing protein
MLRNCRSPFKKTLFKVFALIVFCCSLSSLSLAASPTAVDVYASTLVSTSFSPQSVQVVLEGADFDSTTLTYEIVTGPNSGILSGISGQSVTYTPNNNFVGSDIFTYKVNDGAEDSPIKTATIRVFGAYLDDGLQLGTDIDGEASGDQSGRSVALSSDGSILAVGAPINNGSGSSSGHVRVYEFSRARDAWVQLGADINGEAANDESGRSLALSSNGYTLAVAAPDNTGNAARSGHVRVYRYNNAVGEVGAWGQLGGDIDGEGSGDQSGQSIALSSDGNVLVVGTPETDANSSGHVSVYYYDEFNRVWTQVGADINGESEGDQSGSSVDASSDGLTVAVGSIYNNGAKGANSGHVRVYKYDGSFWLQLGSDIDGHASGDQAGYSVSLSSDGKMLAVGAPDNGGNGSGSGHVRVYKYNDTGWNQLGSDIEGEADYDASGYSVALSSNGLILAVGAPKNNANGVDSGHVRVYQYNGSAWTQLITDIDGEVFRDDSGHSIALSSDGLTLSVGAPFNDGNGDYSGHTRVYQLIGSDQEPPEILTDGIVTSINEDDSILGTVVANEAVFWSIAESGFAISDSGIVTLSSPADYETRTSYTFTITATDLGGNTTTTESLLVNVIDADEIPPVITLIGDVSISLELGSTYTDLGATAADNFDGSLTKSIVTVSDVDLSAVGEYTVTYSVTDAAGNAAAQVIRNLTITPDVTTPVISLVGFTPTSHEVGTLYVDAGAIAKDSVDGDVSGDIVTTGLVDTDIIGSYMLSYNVSDAAGNAATTLTRTVIVEDTGAPVITLLGDASITLEVGDTFIDAGATAIDAVDDDLTDKIVVTGAVDTSSVGIYTLTYNVGDSSGNVASAVTREITVQDTGVPVLTLLGDANVTLEFGATYLDEGASANDDNDGNITAFILTTSSVDTQSVGTYTVTYSVSDAAGNAAMVITRSVTVIDVKAPIIVVVDAQSISLALGTEYIDAGAVALDDVDGDVTSSITTFNPVDVNVGGTYTVTYNVKDAFGNVAKTKSRTVVITTDTTMPVITLLGEAAVSVEQGTGYIDAGARASDVVDGEITSSIITVNPVDVSTVGTYRVSYNVSNAQGNSALEVVRTVTVTADVTKPVITLLGDASMTLEVGDTFTDAGATATDAVDGDLSDKIFVSGVVDSMTAGSYLVTYNVTDSSGNVAFPTTRLVRVIDVTPPVITLIGNASVTLEFGATYLDEGASANDDNDGDITAFIITTSSVDTRSMGTHAVIYNVKDAAGNAANPVMRSVTVLDTTAPEITVVGAESISLELGAPYTDAGVVALDEVDGDVTASITTVNPVDVDTVGTYTVTYSVADASGNVAVKTRTVVITTDTTIPVITLLGEAAVSLEQGTGYNDAGARASDVVDGEITSSIITVNPVDVSTVGTYRVSYNVNDAQGNSALEVVRTVTVTADVTKPVITLLGDASMTLEVGDTFTDAGATATDAVDDNQTLTANMVVTGSVNVSAVGTYTLTYNVSDVSGNAAVAVTRSVAVQDTSAPVITLLGDATMILEVNDIFTDLGATASDSVDGVLTDEIVVTGSVDTSVVGSYTLIYNVKDESGNAATALIRTVDVKDTGAPVITMLGNVTMTLVVGDTFTDPGVTAIDAVDGSLTNDIVVTGSVDASVVDTYILTYNVADAAGNLAEEVSRTVVVEPFPIVLVIPDDLIVNAVGFVTGVDLDPQDIARATNRGDVIDVTADKLGPFESGSYEIVWSAASAGRSLSATQLLTVKPLVALGTSLMVVEGDTVALQVFLSGQAPDYPVTIPFNVGGTAVLGDDYNIEPSESVIISEGILGSINLSITADEVAESQENVVITLGEATNVALGVSVEQVITIVEENLPPRVVMTLSQADVVGSTVSKDSGTVTVFTNIVDANRTDTHTVTWARALQTLPEASVVVVNGEGPEFPYEVLEFDPADLEVGVYSLAVDVSDGENDVSVAVNMNLIDQAPVLSEEFDSDSDGTFDADEGAGDLDGDGIPDYLDNLVALNLIPARDTGAILQSEPGTKLMLGMLALGAGDNNVSIAEEQVMANSDSTDTDFDYPRGLIDFEVTGADFGYSYSLVLPLPTALVDEAVYRKYSALGGWSDFVENATNMISSGMKLEGTCPELGSDAYTLGLTAGDDCLQLMIEEGGPNDADGLVNGTLVDPGGVAVEYFGPPSELSTVTSSRSQLTANGTDSATITVIASDSDGRRLENMTVAASVDISGVAVGAFIELGNGIYTATLTAGNLTGRAAVVVVIDNGQANISLASQAVTLIPIVAQRPGGGGGGCTVATDGSHDASLLLLLMIAGLFVTRRRKQ